jgi:hypothetical protein
MALFICDSIELFFCVLERHVGGEGGVISQPRSATWVEFQLKLRRRILEARWKGYTIV